MKSQRVSMGNCRLFNQRTIVIQIRNFSNSVPIGSIQRMENYIQVLPIIKMSPSHPNGKILLGNWKYGNYQGRYTGMIERIKNESSFLNEKVKRSMYLEEMAKTMVPIEIRDYIDDIKCQGILNFDGPPDSLEYIYVVSIENVIHINDLSFSNDYPYQLQWFDINKIPFEMMPADDKVWYGSVIQGKKVRGSFNFGGHAERTIKSYQLEEVPELEI